jgi:thioredoxin 1
MTIPHFCRTGIAIYIYYIYVLENL